MPFDFATAERLFLKGAGAVLRPASRAAGAAAKVGAPLATTAALATAYSVAKIGAAAAGGIASAAWYGGRAALRGGMGATRWAGRVLGGGKAPFVYEELSLFGKTVRFPHQLNRAGHNAIVFGALGAAGIGGMAAALHGPRWNVNQALSTGALEVERPDSMGATGSLALSMANRGRPAPSVPQAGLSGYARPAMAIGDDLAMMAFHNFLR